MRFYLLAWTVSDDGPGPSAEDFARTTERGDRRDAGGADEAPDRHGLGLGIARDLAARHGLRLRHAARTNGGTRMTLAIPDRDPPASHAT